jgi:hypothetical protein
MNDIKFTPISPVEFYKLESAIMKSDKCIGTEYYELTYKRYSNGVSTIKTITVKGLDSITTKVTEDQLILMAH